MNAIETAQQFPEQKHIPINDYRTYVVVDHLSYIGITVHLLLIPLFLAINFDTLALFNVFSTAAWITARSWNRQEKHIAAFILLTIEIVLHCMLAVYYLGWQAGFQYYLIPTIPLVLFNNMIRTKITLSMSMALCALFTLIYVISSHQVYQHEYPLVIESLNYLNIMTALFALVIICYYFRLASILSEQQMALLANSDHLTGLSNRRGARTLLKKHQLLCERYNTNFTIVIADIDNFKHVNDTYGHDCGDHILQQIAQLLQQHLRQTDVVSRWGGEEFLIILPETTDSSALKACEYIRQTIAAHEFIYDKQKLKATLTLGIIEHKQNLNIDESINRADKALYQGKESGRNQSIIWRDNK